MFESRKGQKQSVMMTPVGKELAERARGILSEVQDFEDRAARENSVGTSSIRFGTIPTVGPYLMPRAMPLLRQRLPETKFYLREELTDRLVDGLMDGRLDLLLLALPHPLPPQIETEVLFSDGYYLATPADHPLGNRDKVGADDLTDRHLLLLEKKATVCKDTHFPASPASTSTRMRAFSATSLSTLVAMVEEDLGITLLPKLAVDAGISKTHHLHLGDVEGAIPRDVALAWRKSSPSADTFRDVGSCLKTAREQLAGS
ncbi:LysR substrate-binding domain-containing protein [Jhaorihella thermophila]